MRLHRRSLNANWPFWLLIAAWFCANLPSTATLHAFVWIKGANHFSHQGELRQNVARLLSGQPRPVSPQLFAAETAQRSLPPALPADVTVKKIDLSLTSGIFRLVATLSAEARPVFIARVPAEPVAEVPHLPPRVRGQV